MPAGGVPDDPARALSVVHVLDTEEYAGRESVVERLASGQRGAGHDARVVAVVEGDDQPPFLDAAQEADLPLQVLRLPRRAYLEERERLVEHLRAHGADVMHSHGYRPDVVAGSAAKAAGAARVSTVHGFVGGGWRNRLYERLQRWSLRRYEGVVAVSTGVAEELIGARVPEDRVHVIRNAWDGRDDFLSPEEARCRLGVGRDRFHIGWVGRLSREKGLDVLLDALGRSAMRDLSVSIIGQGPLRDSLDAPTGAADAVTGGTELHWHGQVDRAYRLFPAFDVFVLSSRTEGTPMVLLEAMAAGVPVVATGVGGVPDVVSGKEALLVPPEDPDALWRAVEEVRRDSAAAEARARAARQRLEAKFDMARWVERYAEVYRTAVRRHADRGTGR